MEVLRGGNRESTIVSKEPVEVLGVDKQVEISHIVRHTYHQFKDTTWAKYEHLLDVLLHNFVNT